MAMTKCKECKKEVSTKAKTCPHCGVKNPGVSAKDMLIGIVVLGVIAWGVFQFMGGDGKQDPAKAAEIAASDAACQKDLKCWGEKNSVSASVYCDDEVEKLAKYSAKWTDGTLEPKFSRYKWLSKENGYVTYIGDKIQFQNGFGAMQGHIYECDYDPKTKAVLAVRAQPGHL